VLFGCRLGPNTDDRLAAKEGRTPRTCDHRTETVHQTYSLSERESVNELRRVHSTQSQPVWYRGQHQYHAAAVHQWLCIRCRRDECVTCRRDQCITCSSVRLASDDQRISSNTLAVVPVQQPPPALLIHKVLGKLSTSEPRQHLL